MELGKLVDHLVRVGEEFVHGQSGNEILASSLVTGLGEAGLGPFSIANYFHYLLDCSILWMEVR
jgi:hypothetical protein